MEFKNIIPEIQDAAAVLTMNRPEVLNEQFGTH